MNQDFELREKDVLELSSQDGVVSFFAKLGYDTDNVVEITPHALGMSGVIRKCKCVAIRLRDSQYCSCDREPRHIPSGLIFC